MSALLARLALLDTKLPPVREDAAWRLLLWMREGYDGVPDPRGPGRRALVDATRDLVLLKWGRVARARETVAAPLAHFELYVECEGPCLLTMFCL